MTDTARHADVVLPATTSLEHADLYRSYGHYAVQRVRPAIPPLGEARPNWEVFRALAAAMGYEEPIFRMTADEAIDLLVARPAGELDRARATGPRLAAGEAGGARRRRAGPRWGTPSGKIELLNPREREPLPRFLPTHAEEGLPAPAGDRARAPHPQLHLPGAAGAARAGRRHGPQALARRGGRPRRSPTGSGWWPANERGEATFALRVRRRRATGRGGGRGGLLAGPRARRPERERAHLPAAHRRGGRLDLLRQPGRGPRRPRTGLSRRRRRIARSGGSGPRHRSSQVVARTLALRQVREARLNRSSRWSRTPATPSRLSHVWHHLRVPQIKRAAPDIPRTSSIPPAARKGHMSDYRYDHRTVQGFILSAIFWGVVGILSGSSSASSSGCPGANFPPFLTYGRLRAGPHQRARLRARRRARSSASATGS